MSDPASHDAKSIWQNQKTEDTTVTLEDIRNRAAKFQKRVRNRNLREYIASAIVIAVFGFYALHLPGWMTKLGSAMTIAAMLFVTWQLHRRGQAHDTPDGATTARLLAFHREELSRQRDMVRTVLWWYMAPFLPGIALIFLGRYFQSHVPGRTLAEDHLVILLGGIIAALIVAIVWLLNMWAAARLQNRIDELDRLRAE
ncbi:MAG: hypothetical protein WBQ17_10880 [Rhizomicrobium sp.]|jgi:hypothetical protein